MRILAAPFGTTAAMGAVEGALWPSTGDIDRETESLAIAIRQLGHDIGNSVTPNSDAYFAFERGWNAFVADFGQWKDGGWYWNPTRRDQLLEYRQRFNALLEQARTFQVASVAVAQKAQPEPDGVDKLLAAVNKVVIVGAAVGVGFVLWKVYKETR